MIPCRRGSGNYGPRVTSGSGWAHAPNPLITGALAAAAVALVVLATHTAEVSSRLEQLPASSGLRSMRQVTEERQREYQEGGRYERLDLELNNLAAASALHAGDQQAQAAGQAGSAADQASLPAGQAGSAANQASLPAGSQAADAGGGMQAAAAEEQLPGEQAAQLPPDEIALNQQPMPELLQPQAQPPQQPGQAVLQQAARPEQREQAGGGTPGQERQQEEPAFPSPYQKFLSRCHDLACLRDAAKKRRAPGQFLFPHFFLVGWQKCATTSLFFHLRNHPQMMVTHSKEPEFFSDTCGFQPHACSLPDQEFYLHSTLRLGEVLAANLTAAGAEASTHYGRNGQLLARGIYEHFPWLKIVASMREPISRAISMLAHNLDKNSKGCLAKRQIYSCLVKELGRTNYSEPFQAWLDVFPREQVLLIQYEKITSETHGREVLRGVKTFLGVDPALPAGEDSIGHNNSRAQRMQRTGEVADGEQALGWPMKRWQYKQLVEMVRPDAERLAAMVDQHGFADGAEFLAAWEAEWEETLEACTPQGECLVLPN